HAPGAAPGLQAGNPRGNRRTTHCCGSSKLRNALGLLQNDPRRVVAGSASWLTPVYDARIGPVGYARAAATRIVVAHQRAPSIAANIAMRIRIRRDGRVYSSVVPGPQNVSNLVSNRIID